MRQLDALTSLRFVAAFAVMIFHYDRYYFPEEHRNTVIQLGSTGVTFFFVLSGFILAYTYHLTDLSDPATRGRYFRARFARIYPVYLLSLVVSLPWFAAWVAKTPSPLGGLMASGAVLAPLGLQAWVPGAACSLNCASWSISVEILFYLLFPFLLPLVMRRPVGFAIVALVLWAAFGAVASYAWSHYAPGVSLIEPEPAGQGAMLLSQAIKYDPLLRLPEFLAGLSLFALWQRLRVPAAGALAVAGLFGILLVAAYDRIPQPLMHNGLTMLVWVPLVLVGANLRSESLPGALFASRPALFLGRISYAFYLFHIPVYAMLATLDRAVLHGLLMQHPWPAALATTAIALIVAAIVHLLVEEPARRALLRPGGWPRLLRSGATPGVVA